MPQPITRLLFVCTGNTCRSPMAEALARQLLDKRGRDDIMVESAGLAADGAPASANAVAVLREVGLDIADRPSQPVTAAMCSRADHIAVMSPQHAAALMVRFGVPADKLSVLGGGIPDPFGGDMAVYRQARDRIRAALEALFSSFQEA